MIARRAGGHLRRAAAAAAAPVARTGAWRHATTLNNVAADDLFDPATFEGTRRPLAEGATALPGGVYTSQAWYEAELKNVFAPNWLLIGRTDELAEPGSYITLDAPGVGPVFAIRDKKGGVRAFANVCRHRGAVLLRDEHGRVGGKARNIVCPYHAWAYGLDGRLKNAPECKPGGKLAPACFDKKEHPLLEVRLEEHRGFLFVNGAGDAAKSLEDSLGNCPELVLDRWPFEDFVTAGRKEYIVDCNWKFLFENTSETYHTSYVHAGSLGQMDSSPVADAVGAAPVGDWDAVHVPGEQSVVPLPGERAPFANVASETFFVNLFPSLQLNVTHDCAWWMRMLPLGVDKTKVTQGFLFPKETAARGSFEADAGHYYFRWDLAVREDNDISENQQRGASSAAYRPGPYNGLEFATHKFDKYVVDKVLGLEDE